MDKILLKNKARVLRRGGRTYSEIQDILNTKIPKSTLSFWCKDIALLPEYAQRIKINNKTHLSHVRQKALAVNRKRREKYIQSIIDRNKHYQNFPKDKQIAKLILAILYLGEGSKSKKQASIVFGNSDPNIIKSFLQLLRFCYNINESKFRCTVQCRADQNIPALEDFWVKITNISLKQFYPSRIDPRTIGKKSIKPNYKGVCRINYFSAHIFNELMIIADLIYKGACSSVD